MTPARTHAVAVGIDRNGVHENRFGLAAQALRFARWLHGRGVPRANVVLLTSPLLADADGFDNRLADFATLKAVLHRQVLELDGDLLWLHWAGHGAVDRAGRRRLMLADATHDDLLNLDLDEHLNLFRSARAHPLWRQIFTIDACQTFPDRRTGELPAGLPVPQHGPPTVDVRQEILFASPYGKRAIHRAEAGGGVFTAALLEALDEVPAGEWPPDVGLLPVRIREHAELIAPDSPGAHRPIQLIHQDEDGSRSETLIMPHPPATTLDDAIRAELAALLGPAGPDEIVDALWRAVDAVAPIPVTDALTLPSVLGRLDQLPSRRGGIPPALSFAEHLAACLPDPAPVQALIDSLAADSQVAPEAIGRVRAAASAPVVETATFVTVRVEPADAGAYRLTATLERDGASLTLRHDDPEPCPEADIQQRCERLVSDVGRFLPRVGREALTFEFLLPWPLLDAAVHHWRPAADGVTGARLGLRGKVVIRSLDRLRFGGLALRDWRDRWARVGADGRVLFLHRSTTLPAYYDSADDTHLVIDRHDAGLLADRFAVADDAVCLVLSYPYAATPVDGLLIAVAAGLPAAVWCAGDDSNALKVVVEDLQKTGDLGRLPDRVFQERRAGGADLTVLWDDPDRNRELNTPLAAPAVSGSKVA
ncbi:hypothetical protein [Actinoplanes sp. URMC 104]|uniref:VMAP-C domain-containing protein n=1 Tax=Actinoplanes sp. URMC 104 TaxID=3423409 RepID=UPI003F1AA609